MGFRFRSRSGTRSMQRKRTGELIQSPEPRPTGSRWKSRSCRSRLRKPARGSGLRPKKAPHF
jgi:hypothetical protein